MTAFLLIHGAWHGAWSWRPLERLLRAAGHQVLAPTLTGLSDRAHLLDRSVGLELHITDVVNVIDAEQASDLTVVAHSYGGMLLPALMRRRPSAIRSVVLLDAFLPEAGESAMGLLPDRAAERYAELASERGDGWRIPVRSARSLGVRDENTDRELRQRFTDQPLKTFTDASAEAASMIETPGRFVLCNGWPTPFGSSAERAAARGWRVDLLDSHHEVAITEPGRVAELVLGAAQRETR